jgi:hypothetical protein
MDTFHDGRSFGEVNFGAAELGDRRRTRRLVKLADQLCRHPGGSLPDKLKSPADLKGLYRLCDCDEVTHEAVLAPHRAVTLSRVQAHRGPLLVIHDATELDYSSRTSLKNLGQIGNGHGRGYICHNSLVVDPHGRTVVGLANQILHRRVTVSKKESKDQRRHRKSRESRLWLEGTKVLPADWRLVDVCDRGADTFEFLEHALNSGRRFIVRSAHNRAMLAGHEEGNTSCKLHTHARSLPTLGCQQVTIPAQDGQPARKITLSVAAGPVRLKAPHSKHGEHGNTSLPLWVVCVREVNPRPGTKALEWILLTNQPTKTFDEACMVVDSYECRWIIEEFHKGKKTGCGVEQLQFTSEDRLQPMIAMLSVVTLTLLNLRDASRQPDAKTRLATEIISVDYVRVLSGWRQKQIHDDWTVHDFFFALARLGGHQNRKNDKQPGWLVLWRGWTTLQAMVDGAAAIRRKKCG